MGCGASMDPRASHFDAYIHMKQLSRSQSRDYASNKFEEWKKSNAAKKLAAALATEEGRVELHTLFKTLDANADGKVTAEEWASGLSKEQFLMEKYFRGVTESENAEIFKKLDVNNDAGLDWNEFVEGAQFQLILGSSEITS